MNHKLIIHRHSMQNVLPGLVGGDMATVFVEYDGQKQLIVAMGESPEIAVDELADKMAGKFSIRKVELLALLRPIFLHCFNGGVVDDVGDGDDIPF